MSTIKIKHTLTTRRTLVVKVDTSQSKEQQAIDIQHAIDEGNFLLEKVEKEEKVEHV